MSVVYKRLSDNAFLLPVLLLLLSPRAAAQTCSPDVAEAPDTAVIEYDPFLPGATVREIAFALSNPSDEECVIDLAILDGAEQPARVFPVPGTTMLLEVRPGDGERGLVPRTVPGVYRATLAPTAVTRFVLDALVVQDAVPEAGSHRTPLTFELREPDQVALVGDAWRSVVIVRSPPRAQLNITGASGSFGTGRTVSTVDFGAAETGATRRIFLQVRANTPSQIVVESANGGVLRRTSDADRTPPIPYEVALDGTVIDLSSMVVVPRDPPRTVDGESISMDFRLGTLGGQMAGRYEDEVTIEFSPL